MTVESTVYRRRLLRAPIRKRSAPGRERDALLWVGTSLLAILLIVGIFAPFFLGSGTATHPQDALLPPSAEHLFGTDRYGRDVLVRSINAIRIDVLLAMVVAGAAFVVGSIIGALSGMIGGYVDEIIMRVTDIVMAFPAFVLALIITASLGNSTAHAAIGVGVAYTPYFIRLTRSRALSVRTLDYVAAAKLAGQDPPRVMLHHVLPNSFQPSVVQATLVGAWAILDIAGLSFLGVGVQPPTAEWGAMIADGYGDIVTGQWWTSAFPGIFILLAAIAFHFIGDALEERVQ